MENMAIGIIMAIENLRQHSILALLSFQFSILAIYTKQKKRWALPSPLLFLISRLRRSRGGRLATP
jgi:hypothetical protein